MKRRSALVTAFPVERHSQRAAFRIATIAIESEHSTRSVDIVHPNRKIRDPASLGFEPRQRLNAWVNQKVRHGFQSRSQTRPARFCGRLYRRFERRAVSTAALALAMNLGAFNGAVAFSVFLFALAPCAPFLGQASRPRV